MTRRPLDKTATTPYNKPSERSEKASKTSKSTSLMPNPSFSRRAFIGGGLITGALTFLGSIVSPGGTVINAYADEAGETHFSIYVLGRDEIPVMAMRKTDSGNVPVAGVKVTITSLYNDKQVTVVTGDDGFAPAHIRDLSFECDDDSADSYAFFGSVTASCDGYRDVHFIYEYFESAVPPADDGSRTNTLELPMEIDDGSAYLLNVSLDEVDILHSSAPAQVGDYNDIEHTVSVEVARTQGFSGDVEVSLIVDDTEWAHATATRDASNPSLCTASFTDYFLSKISRGQKMRVRFTAPGEAAKTVTLPIEFEPGIVFSQTQDKLQCSPGISLIDLTHRPELFGMAWFFGESDTFSFGIPGIPAEFFCDAAGNCGISFTIVTIDLYKRKDGHNIDIPRNEQVKTFGGKYGEAGIDNWIEKTVKPAWKGITEGYNCAANHKGFGVSKFSSYINFGFEASAMGYIKSEYVNQDTKKGDTKGTGFLGLNTKFSLDMGCGQQIIIAMIPMYYSIDFSASLQARIGIGFLFKNWLENLSWSSLSPNIAYIIILYVQAGISIGAGIRGLVSVAVRGYGSVCAALNISPNNNPACIASFQAEIGAQLVIQCFILTKSFLICNPLRYGPVSNAEKSSLAFQDMTGNIDPSGFDMSDAQMIPQSSLKEMSEFKTTQVEKTLSTLTAEHGDKIAEGVLTTMPETYERSRVLFSEAPLIASGPASASGFASPYGALDANGDVLLGASGTSDLAATGTQADFRTVKTYNPRLGLVPVEQEILYDGAFSNSHVRTFVGSAAYSDNPENNTVMARLVTVTYPDNAGKTWTSSRVHVRLWNAEEHAFGDEQVISFGVEGLETKYRFDVDYDLDVIELNGEVFLAMAVTSIELQEDEVIDADTATDRQFITFLVWSISGKYLKWSKSLYSLLVNEKRSTFQPHALFQGENYYSTNLACFYYQRKAVDTQKYEGIFVSPYFTSDAWPLVEDKLGDGLNICAGNPDGTVTTVAGFQVASVDRIGTMYPGYVYTMRVVVAEEKGGGKVTVTSISFDSHMSYNWGSVFLSNVATITPMGTQDTRTLFAYTIDSDVPDKKKNHVIKCTEDQQGIYDEETSGYSADSNIFVSANGKRLYTVRLNEGVDKQLDDETQATLDNGGVLYSTDHYSPQTGANFGGSSTTSDTREPVYQLLESRWIESLGAFHEFYPIARLSFAPDNTSILSCTNGKRDFAMASLTGLPEIGDEDADLSGVKADIYHVSVPDVVAIQCENVSVESAFAAAGDTVAFQVDVSNTGNCLVNGFTVTLRDDNGNVVEQNVYSDLREYLQESPANQHPVRDADGNYTYDEDGSVVSEFVEDIRDTSGILWPGFLRTYRFTFTMPEGYEGETGFTVQVSDPRSNPFANELSADAVAAAVFASNGGLSMPEHLSWLSADDFAEPLFGASLQTICDPRKFPFSLKQTAVSEAMASDFSAVPAVYQTDDEIDGGGYEPSDGDKGDGGSGAGGSGSDSGSNGSGTTTKRRVGTPQTGDSTMSAAAVAAAAAVAVGAAGAAAMASRAEKDDAE